MSEFRKIAKRLSVKSYFKGIYPPNPCTPLECLQYRDQHGEYPFIALECSDNATYQMIIAYQQRRKVYAEFFLTPDAVVAQMSDLLNKNVSNPQNAQIFDFGAGSGQLSIPLAQAGYAKIHAIEYAFDQKQLLHYITKPYQDVINVIDCDLRELSELEKLSPLSDNTDKATHVFSNPPFDPIIQTNVLNAAFRLMSTDAYMVIILPEVTATQTRSKALRAAFDQFVLHETIDLCQKFALTNFNSKIYLLQKP